MSQNIFHGFSICRTSMVFATFVASLCFVHNALGEEVLLEMGENWKYFDAGVAPGEGWTGADFDDKQWSSGKAPLGYGDNHIEHEVSYGNDADAKHITTYFRRTIELQNSSTVKKFQVNLICDDGCVAYINGQEVLRYNMPKGEIANDSTSAQTAQGNAEQHRFTFLVDADKLKTGENTIAARVHQRSRESSDLAFDFALKALVTDGEVAKAKQEQEADKRVAQPTYGGFNRQPPRSKRPPRPVRPELES